MVNTCMTNRGHSILSKKSRQEVLMTLIEKLFNITHNIENVIQGGKLTDAL